MLSIEVIEIKGGSSFFLNFIDVFWMPFKNNQLTNFMSPIKLYEVMSTGKPIVSEDLVELRKSFVPEGQDQITFMTKTD